MTRMSHVVVGINLEDISCAFGVSMSQKPASKQLEENVQQAVEGAKEEITAARRPWYEAIHWGFILIGVYGIQLTLFALLALWVHIPPTLPVHVALTHEFEESQSPWLRFT